MCDVTSNILKWLYPKFLGFNSPLYVFLTHDSLPIIKSVESLIEVKMIYEHVPTYFLIVILFSALNQVKADGEIGGGQSLTRPVNVRFVLSAVYVTA